jgi:GNAT superfamily N-acetyltransferase
MNRILISDDKAKLNIELIHNFLTRSYWAEGRTLEEVKSSIQNSICFGIYLRNEQIGFARVVTDLTVIAYLMDVFILEKFRGQGYSKYLLKKIFEDERFGKIKKWKLATKDAHSLYKKFGFKKVENPDNLMERIVPR